MKDNKVENVKLLGTRDMNMDSKAKALFNGIDYQTDVFLNTMNDFTKPYFNDAQEKFAKNIFLIYRLQKII